MTPNRTVRETLVARRDEHTYVEPKRQLSVVFTNKEIVYILLAVAMITFLITYM